MHVCPSHSSSSPIAELLSNHPDGTTYDPYVQRSTDRPAHVRTNPACIYTVCPGSSNVERIRNGKITELCVPNNGHARVFRSGAVRCRVRCGVTVKLQLRNNYSASRKNARERKRQTVRKRKNERERKKEEKGRVLSSFCCPRQIPRVRKTEIKFEHKINNLERGARHYFGLSTVLPERENYFECAKSAI